MEPQRYSFRLACSQWWNGWRGRRLRWLLTFRLPFAAALAFSVMAVASSVEARPLMGPVIVTASVEAAPLTLPPLPDLWIPTFRQWVKVRKARQSVRSLPQRRLASIENPDNHPGFGTPQIRIGNRPKGVGFGRMAHAVYTGFRTVAAQTWYETNRPTRAEPATWYYIDSAGGSDSNAGTDVAPFQTLTKAQGSHLGGGRVGAPDVGFRLKGTFTDQGIIPAINCTADAMAVFEVWSGFSAEVDANNMGSFDPYCVYCLGRPYIWIEGITLNGATASDKYAIYCAPNGSTYSTNIVILDCPYTGSSVMIGAADCWLEGNTQDNAGSNGFHMGPASAVVVALAGLGAGNVNNGAHSYMVQFKIENSPSSTAGTTEYSLTGTSNGDYSKRSNAVTTTAGNGQVTVTVPVCVNSNCTARLIYRTAADSDPLVYSNYKLLATINDNSTTSYADNTADGSLGAALDSSQWGNGNSGDGMVFLCNGTNSCSRTVVYNNTIGNCGHVGILFTLSGGVTTHEDIRIAFNYVNNTWTGGMGWMFSSGAIVECNRLAGVASNYLTEPRWVQTTQSITVQGDDGFCRYNRVRDSYGQAIFMQGNALGATQHCRRNLVVFNTCADNYGAGLILNSISTGDVKDNVVENNIFWNNCRQGMTSQAEVHGYYSGDIYDFWIYITSMDASLEAGWWISGSSTKLLNGNVFRFNIFSTSPLVLVWVGGSRGGTQSLNFTAAGTAFGSGFTDNLSSNPNFVSTVANNANFFAINAGSPAEDAGRTGSYSYSGSAPDIGVYEVE